MEPIPRLEVVGSKVKGKYFDSYFQQGNFDPAIAQSDYLNALAMQLNYKKPVNFDTFPQAFNPNLGFDNDSLQDSGDQLVRKQTTKRYKTLKLIGLVSLLMLLAACIVVIAFLGYELSSGKSNNVSANDMSSQSLAQVLASRGFIISSPQVEAATKPPVINVQPVQTQPVVNTPATTTTTRATPAPATQPPVTQPPSPAAPVPPPTTAPLPTSTVRTTTVAATPPVLNPFPVEPAQPPAVAPPITQSPPFTAPATTTTPAPTTTTVPPTTPASTTTTVSTTITVPTTTIATTTTTTASTTKLPTAVPLNPPPTAPQSVPPTAPPTTPPTAPPVATTISVTPNPTTTTTLMTTTSSTTSPPQTPTLSTTPYTTTTSTTTLQSTNVTIVTTPAPDPRLKIILPPLKLAGTTVIGCNFTNPTPPPLLIIFRVDPSAPPMPLAIFPRDSPIMLNETLDTTIFAATQSLTGASKLFALRIGRVKCQDIKGYTCFIPETQETPEIVVEANSTMTLPPEIQNTSAIVPAKIIAGQNATIVCTSIEMTGKTVSWEIMLPKATSFSPNPFPGQKLFAQQLNVTSDYNCNIYRSNNVVQQPFDISLNGSQVRCVSGSTGFTSSPAALNIATS